MEPVLLDVHDRSTFGKKLGTLRRSNITPIHVYGLGMTSLSLQVDTSTMLRTLAKVGRTSPLTVRVNGDEHFVMVREVQRHPVTGVPMHVDFLRITAGATITVNVGCDFINEEECPGLKQGGVLNVVRYEIELVCPAASIPESIVIDHIPCPASIPEAA